MKLHKIGKYSLVVILYVVVLFWISTKVWGEPKSTHEKNVHQIFQEYPTRTDIENMKYDVFAECLTSAGHTLYQIKGYQVEKNNGIGVFTVESVVLKSDKYTYVVDVVYEELEDIVLYTKCRVEPGNNFFRTIIPADTLESGTYKIGMLLKDETVIWTPHVLDLCQ